MNWKWFFVALIFWGSFLTAFKLLSYNPTPPLKQSAFQYSTDEHLAGTSRVRYTTNSSFTSTVTELTKPAPTLSWHESLRLEESKLIKQFISINNAAKHINNPFIWNGWYILSAYNKINDRIMPENVELSSSIIGKADKQIIYDTKIYLQVLDKIMDNVWKCQTAYLNAQSLQNHITNDFKKVFELFKPENVSLYNQIKNKIALVTDKIDLLVWIDNFVLNLIKISNTCIIQYNSMHANIMINEISTNAKNVAEILMAGELKYFPRRSGNNRLKQRIKKQK